MAEHVYIWCNKKPSFMYQFIMPNVSKEGNVYRVRFQKNGKRVSKFFQTKKDAVTYRKKVLG